MAVVQPIIPGEVTIHQNSSYACSDGTLKSENDSRAMDSSDREGREELLPGQKPRGNADAGCVSRTQGNAATSTTC